MKKLLCTLLVLAMAMGIGVVLTGCGSDQTELEGTWAREETWVREGIANIEVAFQRSQFTMAWEETKNMAGGSRGREGDVVGSRGGWPFGPWNVYVDTDSSVLTEDDSAGQFFRRSLRHELTGTFSITDDRIEFLCHEGTVIRVEHFSDLTPNTVTIGNIQLIRQ